METKYMLLTGASRGIGHATVKVFQEQGWEILTVSRQPFSERCMWPSGRENHIQADLADTSNIDALADIVRSKLKGGKLAAMVNNAGISPKGPNGERLGVRDTDAATWMHVMNVNLISTALLVRALTPELIAAQASIVNVTSIVGSRVHPFAGVAYAASKAGLAALTRELAHEYGSLGVRVNAIAPGEISTDILSPGTEKIVNDLVPMKRLGTTLEVARTIRFLCSDESSYINGAEIHINGGQHV
ncbi:SDR family oxidoreductase [Vitreoscilla massiliensis]|uniref:SDR family oxidoreductase n=1 Tax=Vitreoscilla massiliensis TaxID=1689272 RepID=A0ABY4E1I4_9NEIS|nr:SDR family oxidoreductase [Vitreoscilla massiliensis]UOO89635.1 SDR family oxidoreductase [Vitreoscilla massiliensis]